MFLALSLVLLDTDRLKDAQTVAGLHRTAL
jgi:hypothetical protein